MFRLIILTFAICCLHFSLRAARITVPVTVQVIDGYASPYKQVKPGDTLLLSAGTRPFLIVKNLTGSPESAIILLNDQGTVEINSDHYFGISIRRSRYLKLCGNGVQDVKHGIRVLNVKGNGVAIGDFSSDIEVSNVEIGNVAFAGIIAKTEPFCGFDRNSFIQENTKVHHCYIYHTGYEGMYIGSAFYSGQVIECNGSPVTILPPLLRNVEVYENTVEYTGWDGIQVSSAIGVNIHSNNIRHDSQEKADWQMNGIIVGEGSTGDIHSNRIENGEGTGIFSNALGDIRIYNNIIVNPGYDNHQASGAYGIYITDAKAFPSMYFSVFNNLIANARKECIRFISRSAKNGNMVFNNILLTGKRNLNDMESIGLNVIGQAVAADNNFETNDASNIRFEEPVKGNYRLQQGSVLIDAGKTIPFSDIRNDIARDPRSSGNAVDIGPYESEYSRETLSGYSSTGSTVYPNPSDLSTAITVSFDNDTEGWIEFIVVDQMGGQRRHLGKQFYKPGRQYRIIESNTLFPGLNLLEIRKRFSSDMVRISIQSD